MTFQTASLVALGGALVALLGFFLPWLVYVNATFSGIQLADALGPALGEVKAGGIKGLDIALFLIPALALVAGGLVLAGARRGAEGRWMIWAAATAIGGLCITLLVLASAVLAGAPGLQFQPGLVRPDGAVRTAIPRATGAGDLVGVGFGLYLVIAGFAATTIGALLTRGARSDPRDAWRTQDYVVLAVIAMVFGAIYWAWLQPYLAVAAIGGQAAQELLFGLWFIAGLFGAYIIRKPGAAFLAETLAAFAEVLLGAPAGPILVITGLIQAIGAELVFAATGYRRWGWGTMLVAGVAAALVALPWNWFRLGYFALEPAFLVVLLGVRIVSGALAGGISKLLGDALARTGSLNAFAIGRERSREV